MKRTQVLKTPAVAVTLLSLLSAAAPLESQYSPRPYTINVDPAFIERTRLKASKFRPTTDITQPAWTDGPPSATIESIAKYWAEEYDWAAEQAQINANFSHFITTLPSPGGNYNAPLDVHFIHQRSPRADAIPILFLHGWPSTSLEWKSIIHPLVDQNDASKPAFHIVAPDLPGFGFSAAPNTPGLGGTEQSTLFASLMQQLGYDRYALYSTDLGYPIALKLVANYESQIINHISDFFIVFPNATDIARYTANTTTPEENTYIASINAFSTSYSAYAEIHSTFPLSIAHALNDSPVGFLAWMYQLVYTVSDQAYTHAELITEALLLYIPGVYGNIRSYKELYPAANFAPERKTSVPTSVLQFGGTAAYEALAGYNYVVSYMRS